MGTFAFAASYLLRSYVAEPQYPRLSRRFRLVLPLSTCSDSEFRSQGRFFRVGVLKEEGGEIIVMTDSVLEEVKVVIRTWRKRHLSSSSPCSFMGIGNWLNELKAEKLIRTTRPPKNSSHYGKKPECKYWSLLDSKSSRHVAMNRQSPTQDR